METFNLVETNAKEYKNNFRQFFYSEFVHLDALAYEYLQWDIFASLVCKILPGSSRLSIGPKICKPVHIRHQRHQAIMGVKGIELRL